MRNSLSSVILPEMVRREEAARPRRSSCWKQATAICALVMFPIVPVVTALRRSLW